MSIRSAQRAIASNGPDQEGDAELDSVGDDEAAETKAPSEYGAAHSQHDLLYGEHGVGRGDGQRTAVGAG